MRFAAGAGMSLGREGHGSKWGEAAVKGSVRSSGEQGAVCRHEGYSTAAEPLRVERGQGGWREIRDMYGEEGG